MGGMGFHMVANWDPSSWSSASCCSNSARRWPCPHPRLETLSALAKETLSLGLLVDGGLFVNLQ